MAGAFSEMLVRIGGDAGPLRKELQRAEKDTGSFASKVGSLGALVAKGAAVGAAGLAGLGGISVKVAADFQKSLSGVQSATGATTEEMAALRAEALKVGKDTSKSASEAVAAFGDLAKAGVSVSDIVGGVGRTTVQLAEATGTSVGAMATLLSDSLNTFKLSADEAGNVANTLARAAAASSIDVGDLAQSLSAGGLVAKNAGLSIDQFSTAIGIMGQQGLKASDAGTSLKAFLAGLTPSSEAAAKAMEQLGISAFDSAGKWKGFPDILANLAHGFAGLSEEQRATTAELLFGSDGIRSFNALVPAHAAGVATATEQWDAFGEAMGKAPGVAEQSALRLKGLSGDIEKLKGSLETVAIGIGTALLPALSHLAQQGARAVDWLLTADWSAVQDGFRRVGDVVRDRVVPAVKEFAGWVRDTLAPALAELWRGEIVPKAEAFGRILRDDVVPAVKEFAGWVRDTLVPALKDAWSSDVVPKAEAFGRILRDDVVPAVTDFARFVRDVAGGALPALRDILGDLVGFLSNHKEIVVAAGAAFVVYHGTLLTVNTAIAAYTLATKLATAAQLLLNVAMTANPIGLVALALAGLTAAAIIVIRNWDDITAALGQAWSAITERVLPALADLAMWLADKLVPAGSPARLLVEGIAAGIDLMVGAIGRVIGPIGDFIGKLGDLASKAKALKDFLPGSLPPLAQGLKNVGEEAELAASKLLGFTHALDTLAAARGPLSTVITQAATTVTRTVGDTIASARDKLMSLFQPVLAALPRADVMRAAFEIVPPERIVNPGQFAGKTAGEADFSRNFIRINEQLAEASKEYIQFVLAHEFGHIISWLEERDPSEAAANAYAARWGFMNAAIEDHLLVLRRLEPLTADVLAKYEAMAAAAAQFEDRDEALGHLAIELANIMHGMDLSEFTTGAEMWSAALAFARGELAGISEDVEDLFTSFLSGQRAWNDEIANSGLALQAVGLSALAELARQQRAWDDFNATVSARTALTTDEITAMVAAAKGFAWPGLRVADDALRDVNGNLKLLSDTLIVIGEDGSTSIRRVADGVVQIADATRDATAAVVQYGIAAATAFQPRQMGASDFPGFGTGTGATAGGGGSVSEREVLPGVIEQTIRWPGGATTVTYRMKSPNTAFGGGVGTTMEDALRMAGAPMNPALLEGWLKGMGGVEAALRNVDTGLVSFGDQLIKAASGVGDFTAAALAASNQLANAQDSIDEQIRRAQEAIERERARGIPPSVPAFQGGISYVPRDMLAWLHRGEAVIPAGGGIDYDRLGGAVARALTEHPPVVAIDGRLLAESAGRRLQTMRGGGW